MLTALREADPRVKRTRQLLQQAMSELLLEKSFLSISVQDVAARATVNRATFYAHFEDKFAIFESLIRDGFQDALESRLSPEVVFDEAGLRLLIQTVTEFMGRLNSRCRKTDRRMDPLVESTAQDTLYRFLLSRLSAEGRRDNLETTASVWSWAIFGAAMQWSRTERAKSAADLADEVFRVLWGERAAV